jgi:hypothetical protein
VEVGPRGEGRFQLGIAGARLDAGPAAWLDGDGASVLAVHGERGEHGASGSPEVCGVIRP